MHQGVLSTLLVALSAAACFAEDAIEHNDPFDSEFKLKWNVIRPLPDHYSLVKNPGELTITTAYGSIHGQTAVDDLARNLMLVDEPVDATFNFEATLAVSEFQPEVYYQQVAILVYQGDDDYAKWSLERSWDDRSVNNLVLVLETAANPTHHFVTKKTIDGPFWLRVRRAGSNYTVFYSDDGDQFEELGTQAWKPSRPTEPVNVGFLAKNGGNANAGDIDVLLEEFTLKLHE